MIEDVTHVANERGIELHTEAEGDTPVVACSPGVLTSCIGNLVRNAIKYMGDAAVRRVVVRVRGAPDGVRVEVEDTGPGLPPGAETRVFDVFVRADRSGQPGLGLGLATVKRLVEAYGGQVGVMSTPHGSTFWFELPRAA